MKPTVTPEEEEQKNALPSSPNWVFDNPMTALSA